MPAAMRDHSCEGRTVHHCAIHTIEQLVENPFARDERADWRCRPNSDFARDHVGLDPPMFDRQKAPGATEPGLNLVNDETGERRIFGIARRRLPGSHIGQVNALP